MGLRINLISSTDNHTIADCCRGEGPAPQKVTSKLSELEIVN